MLRVMNDDNKSRGSYLTAQRFFSFLILFLFDKSPKNHKKTILIFHHDSNKSEIPSKIVTQKQRQSTQNERKICACEH